MAKVETKDFSDFLSQCSSALLKDEDHEIKDFLKRNNHKSMQHVIAEHVIEVAKKYLSDLDS